MKRILYNRLVALLLTICVSISLFTARAHSDDRIDDGGTASSYGEASLAEPADSFETAEQKQLPDLEDLLEQGVEITDLKYLDREAIEDGGAVRRLIDKETLNTYAFLNRDGTESVVMFPHNIKYIDESGAAVEKDLTLVEAKAGGYTVKSNDYDVLFSENVKDGTSFAYSGGTIRLTPESAGGKLVKEENSIAYPGVFGENTILRYTPRLNGVKEDIVLEEYTGVSSFKFKLAVDKLLLSDKEGRIEFIDENGEPVIEFSDVIAYDSSGMVVNGTLLVEKTTEGTDYSVTVSVPEKFLTDPKTVYPVTIDPTISTDPRNCAIQDAPIYESKNDMNFGARLYNDIGNATYGKSRTAVWLSGLETHPIYRTLDAEEIVSVVLSVRETTGTSGLFVNLYRITDFVLWTESTVTWDNVGSHSEDINAGGMLNQSSRAYFDITNWAKGWQNCSYTRTMRVIFTMSGGETSAHKQFDSAQCSDITKQPYVTFTYQLKNLMNGGTYYIRNKHIDRFVQPTGGSTSANAKLELNAFTGNDIQKWIVTSRGNGFYTIKNVQTNYVLSVPSGSYSTYDVQLTQASNTNADGQQWRIYMTSYCGFAIKPKSSCGPGDGQNWSDHTMSVADGNDGNGALVTQRPYVYNNSYKDEWYLVPTDVPGTTERTITNRQLGTNVQPYGGIVYSNNSVVLWEQTSNNAQKWNFTSVGDGYCKITPKGYSSCALSIASGSETTENGTVRIETYSSGNTRQQWFIYKVPNGYVLKARSAGINNLVLSVSEGNLGNGAVVSQRAYINNLSYKEEWFIGEPPLDGVYYIINGTMYCEAAWPKAKDHENVDLYELFPPNGDVAFRAAQMWRIKYLGGGRYSVRPLHKLNMGLNAYGSNVDIIDISASDTTYAIDDSAEWCIEPFGDKYVFMNYGDTGKALTATGITNNSDVTVSSYADGNSFQLWTLTKVPEPSIPKDILFYSASSGYIVTNQTRYIAPEETLTLSDMDILIGAIDAYNISQYGTWSVASGDKQYMTVNSASGAATGKKHKTAGITVTCSRFISGTTCSKSYTMNVTAIPNGTYFLKNKQNSDYAKVKNDSLANNQNAVQYDFDGSNYERWTFRLNGLTGYYSIKSAASGSISYYLAVKDDSPALDHQIVVRSATEASLTNGMKWRVQTTASGAYKIIPKTGEANDYVLATSTSLGTNNANLVQGDYILNNSYRDEWDLVRLCAWSAVSLEGQKKTNWCWVASARMFSKHFYNSIIVTQNEAVTFVKGSEANDAGTNAEIIAAINYFTDSVMEDRLSLLDKNHVIYDESTLIAFIDEGLVVAVGRQKYPILDVHFPLTAHEVLVVGYVSIHNDIRFVVYNPWPVNEGEVSFFSYEKLVNGRNNQPGEENDISIWIDSVVINTDYANTTIPYYFDQD